MGVGGPIGSAAELMIAPTAQPKTPLASSTLALVAANLVPIGGVIGVVTVLKMLSLPPREPGRGSGRGLIVPLFLFHYGAFMFGHGVFLVVVFAAQRPDGLEGREAFERIVDQMLDPGVFWAALGLAVSHGWSFVTNYLRGPERQAASLKHLMMAPYGRIILLHLFIIGGAWVTLRFGSPIGLLLLFVGMKTIVDLLAHTHEHRKAQAQAAGAQPPPLPETEENPI